MLPDHNLYLTVENDEFSIIDYGDIKNELKTGREKVEQFLNDKPGIKKQIQNHTEKHEEGMLIAFNNETNKYTIESIGKLMEKAGHIFNEITKQKFSLSVNYPFQSSFGISLNIDKDNRIGENDEVINRFMDILKFVTNSKDVPQNFLNLYGKKEKRIAVIIGNTRA
ncbi:hypothetical protein ACEE96_02150 [Staphylococcus simulans]